MDNKDFNMISENMAQELSKVFQEMNESFKEFEGVYERSFGVILSEVKLKCAEKLVFYACKYAQATFLTRWYWKRKMEKFVKGIDVLKEL